MNYLEGKLAEAYDCLSSISQMAYKETYLISNQVLSKNPFTSAFVRKVVFSLQADKVGLTRIWKKLLRYYAKSGRLFLHYILIFVLYRIMGMRDQRVLSGPGSDLVLINTFFLVESIRREGRFEDKYFPGLEDVLKERNRRFAYFPVFYEAGGPLKLLSILRFLRRQSVPIICEFDLLKQVDLLRLFFFVVAYPFYVIRLASQTSGKTEILKVLKEELLSTLDQVTFHGHLRYLAGRRLAEFSDHNLKVISWYENQVIDKNLYKGLRQGRSNIVIYGAQLFLASRAELNTVVDENERRFDVIPDRILVNGSGFLPETANEMYSVGPSLRYKRLFEVRLDSNKQNKILVLLPYYREDAYYILETVLKASIQDYELIIKGHPAHPEFFEDLKKPGLLPRNWFFADDNIYELFPYAKIVIGAASGSILEAASLGIPVILITRPESMDSGILPKYGKNMIWEETQSAQQLGEYLRSFEERLVRDRARIAAIAEYYKQQFYCYPSEEKIIDAFDL